MIYTVEQIQRIISPIAEAYNVASLSLFGSYARGEAREDSDIDLLLDRTGMASGWAIGGLYADLSDALGKELDLVTTTGADPDFLARIHRDAIPLYRAPSAVHSA